VLSEVRQRAFGFFEQTYPTTLQNALWRKFEQSENKAKVSEALFCSTLGIYEVFLERSGRKIWEKEFFLP
ncbi:MAG: hypothetical protein V1891_01530, partial [bacterium]